MAALSRFPCAFCAVHSSLMPQFDPVRVASPANTATPILTTPLLVQKYTPQTPSGLSTGSVNSSPADTPAPRIEHIRTPLVPISILLFLGAAGTAVGVLLAANFSPFIRGREGDAACAKVECDSQRDHLQQMAFAAVAFACLGILFLAYIIYRHFVRQRRVHLSLMLLSGWGTPIAAIACFWIGHTDHLDAAAALVGGDSKKNTFTNMSVVLLVIESSLVLLSLVLLRYQIQTPPELDHRRHPRNKPAGTPMSV